MPSKTLSDRNASLRVLVLEPDERDAARMCEHLARERMAFGVCGSVEQLGRELAEGAGTALISADVVDARALCSLRSALAAQPAWSDFPWIVLGNLHDPAHASRLERVLQELGNATPLERNFEPCELSTAVRAALRARTRQYETRRALACRDRFLAVLGHELRNPLGAIELALQTWQAQAGDDRASDRYVGVIARQSRQLTRLVDDLLDVSRIHHGKVALERNRVDLDDIVRGCVEAVEPRAIASQLSLAVDHAAEPLVVWGDHGRLEQVFINLLTNAVKYTPRGGAVRVRVQRDRWCAVVHVSDTGIGIEPAMLDRVFEPFAQAERSLDRAEGGMGLGLTLVQTLVRMHGGEVEVQSSGLGCGSEFRVTLPLAPSWHALPRPRAHERSSVRAQRVVLVEDDADVRSMLEEALSLRGHQVMTSSDGPQGVARILEMRPDVAFVDVGLPGFDGFEVARRVRREAGSNVRLIAVTGYGLPEDRERAFAAGFDLQLIKPVRLEDLDAALSPISGAAS